MNTLAQLTEQLAASVIQADPTDLPALAQLHEQLSQFAAALADPSAASASQQSLQQTATSAGNLVERIILREVDDATAALEQVMNAICELQETVAGSSSHAVDPIAQPPSTSPQAEPPSAASLDPDAPTSSPFALSQPAPEPQTADNPINPDDIPLVLEFVTEAIGHIESAEAAVLQLEESPDNTEVVNAIFRSFHTIKGVAGFLNLRQIGSLSHAAESVLDLARQGHLRLEHEAVDVVLQSLDLLKTMINSLREAAHAGIAPPHQGSLPGLLVRLQQIAAGNPTHADSQPPAAAAPAPQAHPDPSPEMPTAEPAASARAAQASEAFVKISTERLDCLINTVGELVIAQSMVSQDVATIAATNQRLGRNTAHLAKIARELQDLSMSMRMVPIQGVFQKMARLVRDVARKALKQVDFHITGAETELDRNIVEAISDPLVHMVRNAVDHGIEPPDERIRLGKPPAGRIELKAFHQAGNIIIEISDDGRGLNKARLLAKARAAGIVREGEELAEQDIFKLIFHAGLSTAEQVTDISGRGVGMDVVKRNVEALRGRIEIASTEGKGSTFTIRLPLTLAVIDGQVVRVGSERYIIPITSIEQSIQPRPQQLSTVNNRGEMCMVRGRLLPLFRLYRLFNVKPQSEDPTQSLVVIVQDDQDRCCLLVDELLGQQQVVIKSLGESLGQVPGISGGAILGDGNVSLILDIPGLIHMASGRNA